MTKKAPATATSGLRLSSRIRGLLLVLAIVLLAANLRPALTSVAPLIGQIRTDTGVSNGVAGLLTGLPLLAFAVLSPIAPRLARRFDMERVLLASLLVLAVGILLRSAGVVAALFLGTAILGAAIAVGNVLLPSLVKREFPERTGLMTSTYTTALAVSAAIAAGASFPIAYQVDIGWRGSLALWALLALVAAVAWFPQIRSADPANASTGTSRGVTGLWGSVLAWQVTLFMGLQSLGYYVVLTWLPEILQEEVGVSASQAGWMLALAQVVVIPAMFIAPVLADRRPSQYSVVVVAVTLTGVGTLGLLVAASTATVLWIVLLGLGQGACFSLALTFFALRAPDSAHAAALSGMAQSIGYLLAAGGPFLFGLLRDATHAWTAPLTLLVAVTVCLLITGLGAARDAHVGRA
ncbi:MAG TPA: MFS transporter [Rubrobacteraceae bacterium]|jgi:CP family cyanate transporter-like MFS transporter